MDAMFETRKRFDRESISCRIEECFDSSNLLSIEIRSRKRWNGMKNFFNENLEYFITCWVNWVWSVSKRNFKISLN